MAMPDCIQVAQYDSLRNEINEFVTPDGEPAEDALSIVCYVIERALQQGAGGMSKHEYVALATIAGAINEEGSGNITIPGSWESARESSALISAFAEAYADNSQRGIELPTGLDYPELTDDEIATATAMAERIRKSTKGDMPTFVTSTPIMIRAANAKQAQERFDEFATLVNQTLEDEGRTTNVIVMEDNSSIERFED